MADEVLHEESCIGCPPIDYGGRLAMVMVAGEWAVQLVESDGGSGAIGWPGATKA